MSVQAPRGNLLRVVPNQQLVAAESNAMIGRAAADEAARNAERWTLNLANYVDAEFERFRRHRDAYWGIRLQIASFMFEGRYTQKQLEAIKRFGGSDIYARLVGAKCRGASSLLRDVYLGADKPWGLQPTPEPTLPDDIMGNITQLLQVEIANQQRLGGSIDPQAIRDRMTTLVLAARKASIKKARIEAGAAQAKVDDLLTEGGFYQALADFLVDLPLFPFAVIKGPVVKITPRVTWTNGKAAVADTPLMTWYRVSPYDIWWTPGVSSIAEAAVVERQRVTRSDLNKLLGLPGYNEEALRAALRDYGIVGYVADASDSLAAQRADSESRENPQTNESGIIDMIEYHGYVQGSMLIDWGLTEKDCPDPDRDYFVDVFKVGKYIIKVQLSPSLRQRPPYYITSFEKVPGTLVGNALPDLLGDLQDVQNAALRALVNNMSIASGPQVIINDDRLAENEDSDDFYPWKRWHTTTDPLGNNAQKPIDFMQPSSNAQELLGVFKEFNNMADDLSAIPKYITGSDRLGGAGRTASGLAMLMGNASKILQTVAANVDKDVIGPMLSELYDMIMLTDTSGILRGDESIEVLGVNVAVQRETQRQRQLEMLQITANPIDMQIMGVRGRANILRSVADGIGLPGQDIVPPDDEIAAQQKAAEASGMPPGAPPPGGGGGPPGGPPGGAPANPPGPGAPPPQMQQAPQSAPPQGANVVQ